eukprot:Hpha_TRINITY_DN25886_c0_g1::TRINITY_DN25886_c0_g1_i1::g.20008::m.20008
MSTEATKEEYDKHAGDYAALVGALHVQAEDHTFSVHVKDLVKGARALDIASGEGRFARILVELGAGSVVGLDLSGDMVKIAQEIEEKAPKGIKYGVHDILKPLDTAPYGGAFDVISCCYLLCYANTLDMLKGFLTNLGAALRSGGSLVGLNDNHRLLPRDYLANSHYGMIKTTSPENAYHSVQHDTLPPGAEVTWEFFKPARFSSKVWIWTEEQYNEAFEAAGFTNLRFHRLVPDPKWNELERQHGRAHCSQRSFVIYFSATKK